MEQPRSWANALLGFAITVAISVLLLSWAVEVLRPIFPLLGLLLTLGLAAKLLWSLRRHW